MQTVWSSCAFQAKLGSLYEMARDTNGQVFSWKFWKYLSATQIETTMVSSDRSYCIWNMPSNGPQAWTWSSSHPDYWKNGEKVIKLDEFPRQAFCSCCTGREHDESEVFKKGAKHHVNEIIYLIFVLGRCPHCHDLVNQVGGDHRRNTCICHHRPAENGQVELLLMNKSAALNLFYLFTYIVRLGSRPTLF